MSGFTKLLLGCSAIGGFLGVALGAFGAHALKTRIGADLMTTYQTAVQYQFLHALGLGLIGVLLLHQPASRTLQCAGLLMLLGIVLFSGSLYALVFSGARNWGMITPLGGLCWLIAWALFAWSVYRWPQA